LGIEPLDIHLTFDIWKFDIIFIQDCMIKKILEKILKELPSKPGVYLFYNNKGKIIYIGKAANLKSRVRQYWQKSVMLTPAKHSMMKKIAKIDFRVCDSEIEALILEGNLIKKHQPEYNVIMRDDKSFSYIKITTEDEWPTVIMTRQVEPGGKYFGPFTSVTAVKETLKLLGKIFPYRKCKMSKDKVCLFGRLGTCPCNGQIEKHEYKKMIKEISMFLEGKKKTILRDLKKQLKNLEPRTSTNEKIEKLKWKIINLEKVLAHKHILGLEDKVEVDLSELTKELSLKKVPERIEGYDVSNIYGQQAAGAMVVFKNGRPEKSEYRRFKIKTVGGIDDVAMLKEVLTRRLKRTKIIRQAQGSTRTRTRTRTAQDAGWALPDLIIVDGGKGQLNAAQKVLDEYKLKIPVISLAKRLEEVYVPGEIKARVLTRNSPALHLIQRVRDEAHRFAVSYHRLLRKKKGLTIIS